MKDMNGLVRNEVRKDIAGAFRFPGKFENRKRALYVFHAQVHHGGYKK